MQDFYRCQEGYEAKAASISKETAKKLVKDSTTRRASRPSSTTMLNTEG